MDYKTVRTEVRLLAQRLGQGQTGYFDCVSPTCKRGRRKLSITRTDNGLLWNCFKLGCEVRGSTVESAALTPAPKAATKLKPYTKPLYPLDDIDTNYFLDRFGLTEPFARRYISRTEDARYALPVENYLGHTSGWIIREPHWKGIECPRKGTVFGSRGGTKAVTYMHADSPTQSWYTSNLGGDKLVLVEDQLSGMCAAQAGVNAVALLGTQLDARKVREISQARPAEVIIALDEDATDQAFKLARKWGLAFPKVRVAILEQDLKDTDNDDIAEVLGL